MRKSRLFIAGPTGHTITVPVEKLTENNTVEIFPAPSVVLADKPTSQQQRSLLKRHHRLECYPPPLVVLAKKEGG